MQWKIVLEGKKREALISTQSVPRWKSRKQDLHTADADGSSCGAVLSGLSQSKLIKGVFVLVLSGRASVNRMARLPAATLRPSSHGDDRVSSWSNFPSD